LACLTVAFAAAEPAVLPNFHEVNTHVYRGGQPTAQGFEQLKKLGIKTVVDLRDVGEHSQAGEEKILSALGMTYISIPMKGLSAPTGEQILAAMKALGDKTDGSVFVHCRRGADRTGTILAVYRILHDGWTNRKALEEAKENGMSFFERAMQHYILSVDPSSGPLREAASLLGQSLAKSNSARSD
jgi:protein tyrosine/serine phosphatase